MAARRRRTVPATAPACHRAHVDEGLLLEARKKAMLLLLASEKACEGDTYVYETFGQDDALFVLVLQLAQDLAALGKQAAGEAEQAVA